MKLDKGGRSITNVREFNIQTYVMLWFNHNIDDVNTLTVQRDLNDLELNLEPFMVDDMHKDEHFQHIDDQHQSSSSADVLLDMDASHQPEQVEDFLIKL